MSNERKDPEMDTLVAQTYKALATERAPEHLNRKVMAMAARETRTRFGPARTWIRPMAWAATIGLSLAIVLDLTQLPTSEVDSRSYNVPSEPAVTPEDPAAPPAPPAPQTDELAGNTAVKLRRDKSAVAASQADDAAPKEALAQDTDVLREAEERARSQAGASEPAVSAPPESSTIDPAIAVEEKSAAKPVETGAAITARTRLDTVTSTQRASKDIAKRRAQAGESLAATSLSAVSEEPWPESDWPCPAALRESAESWLGCIAELRSEDRHDLADYETREFERKYPSYKAPAADK